MHRRRPLSLAGLLALVSAAVLSASAQAATLGPATFVRATGGSYTVPVHPGGLSVYPSSPAHVVLESSFTTTLLKRDALRHNFPWVAVPDVRGDTTGLDCFNNGHLVTTKSLVDNFTENRVAYSGMFLQYSSWHFQGGATKASQCAPSIGAVNLIPSIKLTAKSATLHLDCMIRNCKGTLIAYGGRGSCAKPKTLARGLTGCLPAVNGRFTISGGLSVNVHLPLQGRPARSTLLEITLNGKTGPPTRLSSLPHVFPTPARQHTSSLSLTCPATAKLGTPVTVSGTLSPGGGPVPVTLTFVGAGSASSSVTATTSTNGAFSAGFTPTGGLVWVVDAVFAGDRTRTHAEKACGFSATQ